MGGETYVESQITTLTIHIFINVYIPNLLTLTVGSFLLKRNIQTGADSRSEKNQNQNNHLHPHVSSLAADSNSPSASQSPSLRKQLGSRSSRSLSSRPTSSPRPSSLHSPRATTLALQSGYAVSFSRHLQTTRKPCGRLQKSGRSTTRTSYQLDCGRGVAIRITLER